jgi:hypothetical protein
MEAGIAGILKLDGPCLGLDMGQSGFRTIIWHSGARLGSDRQGLYVTEGGERFRLGEELAGGGGTMPDDFGDAVLQSPYPEECGRNMALEFGGIRRLDPAREGPPPVAPPPPPLPPPHPDKGR